VQRRPVQVGVDQQDFVAGVRGRGRGQVRGDRTDALPANATRYA